MLSKMEKGLLVFWNITAKTTLNWQFLQLDLEFSYTQRKSSFVIFQYGWAQYEWSSSLNRCPPKFSSFFTKHISYGLQLWNLFHNNKDRKISLENTLNIYIYTSMWETNYYTNIYKNAFHWASACTHRSFYNKQRQNWKVCLNPVFPKNTGLSVTCQINKAYELQ